jgi:hypothetical protein
VVPEAWVEPHAVNGRLVWADGDAVPGRIDETVPLAKVILLRRLVEDVGDHAVELDAELVVGLLVREAASGEQADLLGRAVGLGHVVERAVVLGIERAHRAVCSDAAMGGRHGQDVSVRQRATGAGRVCSGTEGTDAPGVTGGVQDITGALCSSYSSPSGCNGGEEHRGAVHRWLNFRLRGDAGPRRRPRFI